MANGIQGENVYSVGFLPLRMFRHAMDVQIIDNS